MKYSQLHWLGKLGVEMLHNSTVLLAHSAIGIKLVNHSVDSGDIHRQVDGNLFQGEPLNMMLPDHPPMEVIAVSASPGQLTRVSLARTKRVVATDISKERARLCTY